MGGLVQSVGNGDRQRRRRRREARSSNTLGSIVNQTSHVVPGGFPVVAIVVFVVVALVVDQPDPLQLRPLRPGVAPASPIRLRRVVGRMCTQHNRQAISRGRPGSASGWIQPSANRTDSGVGRGPALAPRNRPFVVLGARLHALGRAEFMPLHSVARV